MKALTLTQPWASLVAIGEKRIETRSWGTNYRGPLAIHAAKGMPREATALCLDEPAFHDTLRAAGFIKCSGPGVCGFSKPLPRGAVVATCRLVDCLPIAAKPIGGQHCVAPDGDDPLIRVWHPMEVHGALGHYSDMTTEHDLDFGDYTPGRFAWLLDDIQPLPEPVPARGSLGLWNWAREVES